MEITYLPAVFEFTIQGWLGTVNSNDLSDVSQTGYCQK